MAHLSATVCWGSIRNRDCILYPGVGTFVLIRPTQTFYERIMIDLQHARFITDGHAAYRRAREQFDHRVIDHGIEYLRDGDIHTHNI